ncbi:hypothetical protein FJ208_01550 [Candidatus Gribaldobacteria bacterium]|nr:hypothetical protein [Candidatus Gribaldobacteria bacterium]
MCLFRRLDLDRKALKQFLISKNSSPLPSINLLDKISLINGNYSPPKNQINIYLRPFTPKSLFLYLQFLMVSNQNRIKAKRRFIAKILAHELGHYFDKGLSRKNVFIEIIALIIFIAFFVSLAGYLVRIPMAVLTVFIILISYLIYKAHPSERKARIFARNNWLTLERFIQITT